MTFWCSTKRVLLDPAYNILVAQSPFLVMLEVIVLCLRRTVLPYDRKLSTCFRYQQRFGIRFLLTHQWRNTSYLRIQQRTVITIFHNFRFLLVVSKKRPRRCASPNSILALSSIPVQNHKDVYWITVRTTCTQFQRLFPSVQQLHSCHKQM